MRRTIAIGAAMVTLLALPNAAGAATDVGSSCFAEKLTFAPYVMVEEIAPPTNKQPPSVPAPGVVTQWTVPAEAFGSEPTVEYLKVLRPGKPGEFRVIGESTSVLVGPGQPPSKTRIPVQAGDRMGVYGPEGVFFCEAASAGAGTFSLNGTLALGDSALFSAAPNIQPAVTARVEADGDNDGYGDETQDLCPQSALWHEIPCPPLTLSFFSLQAKKAVFVYVSAGVAAKITVSAQVSKKLKLKPVKHQTNPGQITKYKLPLAGALKRKLAKTPSRKTLGLKVTASGANVAGVVKSETRTLRLKGRG